MLRFMLVSYLCHIFGKEYAEFRFISYLIYFIS